jgi:hypothetical protein
LLAEGYPVQFVLLSDQNATDFNGLTTVPIFRDASPGRVRWAEMQQGAVKHDTFVYSRTGARTLFWDASARNLSNWSKEIRAAVEAMGK